MIATPLINSASGPPPRATFLETLRSRLFWKLLTVSVFGVVMAVTLAGSLLLWQKREVLAARVGERVKWMLSQVVWEQANNPAPHVSFESLPGVGGSETEGVWITLARGTVLGGKGSYDPSPPPLVPGDLEASEQRLTTQLDRGKTWVYGYRTLPPDRVIYARAVLDPAVSDLGLQQLLWGGALAVVVTFLMAIGVARSLLTPLVAMAGVARAISRGEGGARLSAHMTDELGAAARAFNRMTQELQNRLQLITRERNQLLTVLGGMVEGVVAVDSQERVLHMNEVAIRLLGVPTVQFESKRIWELTRVREISSSLRGTMESRQPTSTVAEFLGPPAKTLSLAAAPLRDGDVVVGAVVVIHDVTRLRRLEAMRRDFVANVSHELKTPITVIQGSAEVLADDPDMDPTYRTRFLDKIKNQVQRLSALVNDLLTLARIEAEGVETQPKRVNLCELVRSSLSAMTPIPGKPDLAIDVQLPAAALKVFADEESLRQITDNLLNNALKYTPDGGKVTVSLYEEESTVLLRVADSGPGIEPAHLDRIFERFYRVDSARTREQGGTGLGLAIVKHMSLSMGGDIRVRSTPGQGSEFTAVIPKVAKGATQGSAE